MVCAVSDFVSGAAGAPLKRGDKTAQHEDDYILIVLFIGCLDVCRQHAAERTPRSSCWGLHPFLRMDLAVAGKCAQGFGVHVNQMSGRRQSLAYVSCCCR